MSPEPAPTDAPGLVARAAALGVTLPEDRAAALLAFLDAVLAANEHINLTGIRDRERAVVLHVLDGLAAGLLPLRPRRVLEIGTGNGFPGVCLHALWPEARCTLIDRTHKKLDAVRRCLDEAGLAAVETIAADAEQAHAHHPGLLGTDLVAARALGPPARCAHLAERLCTRGCHLALWVEAHREPPPKLPGHFELGNVVDYTLPPPTERPRRLLSYRK